MEAWLDEERKKALEAIAGAVDKNDVPTARITVGGLRLCEAVLSAFHPSEQPQAEPEPEFHDPAQIRRKVKQ